MAVGMTRLRAARTQSQSGDGHASARPYGKAGRGVAVAGVRRRVCQRVVFGPWLGEGEGDSSNSSAWTIDSASFAIGIRRS